MAILRIQFENGDPEKVIEFDPSKAPFHHDGKPGSILDLMLGHGIHLEHACGGNCACTTCHVIVKQGFNKLGESSEQEEDLLDKAPVSTIGKAAYLFMKVAIKPPRMMKGARWA